LQKRQIKPGYKLLTSFPSFIKIEIPEKWECPTINDIVELERGISYSSDEINSEERGDLLINLNCFERGGGFVDKGIVYFTGITTKAPIKENDMLISITDLTREGNVIGFPLFVPKSQKKKQIFHSMDTCLLKLKNDKYDKKFLFYLFSTKFFHKSATSLSAGTTVLHLDTDSLKKVKVPVPKTSKEQEKIAKILENIDTIIKQTTNIIEHTLQIKKAFIQQLLIKGINPTKSQKIKWLFQKELEIPEKWKEVKLNKIAKVIDSLHVTPEYSSKGIPMIRSTDIKSGDLKFDQSVYVTDQIYKDFTINHKPQRDDIVMSRVGTYFVTSFVNTDEQFCIGQNTLVIHPKINPRFLYYVMNSTYISKQIEFLFDRTSGQKTISMANIRKLRIFLPSPEEQEEIASKITNVESLIQNQKKYKTELISLKKGLMQKLLTGVIRVKV